MGVVAFARILGGGLDSHPVEAAVDEEECCREEQDGKVRSVTLTIASPQYGRVAVDWNGSIVLIASSGSEDPAVNQLGRVGMLPPKDTPSEPPKATMRAELQVGDVVEAQVDSNGQVTSITKAQ